MKRSRVHIPVAGIANEELKRLEHHLITRPGISIPQRYWHLAEDCLIHTFVRVAELRGIDVEQFCYVEQINMLADAVGFSTEDNRKVILAYLSYEVYRGNAKLMVDGRALLPYMVFGRVVDIAESAMVFLRKELLEHTTLDVSEEEYGKQVFACNLRRYRVKSRYSQKQLAELVGHTQTVLCGLEHCRTRLTRSLCNDIASMLGVSPETLHEGFTSWIV